MADIHCNDAVVKAIQGSVKTEIINDVVGNQYSTRPVHLLPEIPVKKPRAAMIVHTLTGGLDFLHHYNREECSTAYPEMIHIVDYNRVDVLSRLIDDTERAGFITAQLPLIIDPKKFDFGVWYDQETMVIALQTLFVPTEEIKTLLKVIGNVKDERVANLSDDGFSQTVAARSGIASVAEVELPNPVKLRHYRTFLEIDQPESLFVVRARQGKPLPEFSIHLADAGLWKLMAIQSIKEYFKAQGIELPIIG